MKLWVVEFTKTDEFKQVSRAMELKGHSAGVFHFSFSADSTRLELIHCHCITVFIPKALMEGHVSKF